MASPLLSIQTPAIIISERKLVPAIQNKHPNSIYIDPKTYKMRSDEIVLICTSLLKNQVTVIFGSEHFDLQFINGSDGYSVYHIATLRKVTQNTHLYKKEIKMEQIKKSIQIISIPLTKTQKQSMEAEGHSTAPLPLFKRGSVLEVQTEQGVYEPVKVTKVEYDPDDDKKQTVYYNSGIVSLPVEANLIRLTEEDEYKAIELNLKHDRYFGMHLIECEAVGNCGFEAFVKGINTSDKTICENHLVARQDCVATMEKHYDTFKTYFDIAYFDSKVFEHSFDGYLQAMKKARTWCDNICFTALALAYHVDIEVLEVDVLSRKFVKKRNPERTIPPKQLLTLVFVRKNHYEVLKSFLNDSGSPSAEKWCCDVCTLENEPQYEECAMCKREKRGCDEWRCVSCETKNKEGEWCCKGCDRNRIRK
eukprot:563591_1